MAMAWEVTAVRYATLVQPRRGAYYRFEAYGEADAEIPMDYFFWVLRSGGRTIVVDTGFDPEAGARRGRTVPVPSASRRSAARHRSRAGSTS